MKSNMWTSTNTGDKNIIYTEMKESTLIKMQYDIKIMQQALVVALHKIEKLEAVKEKKDKV